jgi:hypothetical protein
MSPGKYLLANKSILRTFGVKGPKQTYRFHFLSHLLYVPDNRDQRGGSTRLLEI